jgi:hypothetical protein
MFRRGFKFKCLLKRPSELVNALLHDIVGKAVRFIGNEPRNCCYLSSRSTTFAELNPGAPVTPPPG